MHSCYQKLKVFTFFAFLLFLLSNSSKASHLVGGDLTVDKVGNNKYEITLNYFYDCGGNPGAFASDTPPTIEYESTNCGQSGSTNLSSIDGTGKDIAPICEERSSRCAAGNTKGIENWVFKDTVTLPQKCTDWKFFWYAQARSEAITTLQNPGNEFLYLEAEINNDSFPDNNIPEFTNSPVAFICKDQDFVFNNGVVDQDGDSLVYSFYKPKSYDQNLLGPDTPEPVTYKSGYSYQQPLKSSPPVSIDSSTGDVKLSPTKIDTTVLGVKVEEYDTSGVLKSKILRDIQVIVTNCSSPSAPDLTGVSDSADNYDSTNANFDTTVCPGQPVTFFVNASEPSGNDTLFMDWNGAIPGASFQVFEDSTTSPYGKFTWRPPNPKAGQGISRNTFTVSVRDDNCPYFTEVSRGFVVNVVPSKTVDLGDTAYVACDDSLKLKPVVKGGSADSNLVYDWSTGQKGDSIYIQEPGKYAVTVKDSGNCPITDSIQVLPSLNPSYQITSSFAADRGCVTDSVQFSDSSRSEKAIVNSWDWDFGDGDSSDLQNPKHKFADTGNYDIQLIIADTNNCQDTLNQTIAIDSKPQASFTFKKACSRDSTAFTDQSTVEKGRIFNYKWDFGDGDSSTKPSPDHVYDTGAKYTAELVVTTVGSCKDTALESFRINPTPVADFTSDNTCKGLNTQYKERTSIEPEDSVTIYSWQLKSGISSNKPNPTITYNNTGTYNVSLAAISSKNCSDTAEKAIKVNTKPDLNTLSDSTFCKGDSVNLVTTISPDTNTKLFKDDFEGGVKSSNWLSTSKGSTGSYCGTQQGSDALYFDGDGSERQAITKDMDTRKASTLTFYFKYGTGNNNILSPSGCDAIESGETVSIDYSTDGGSSWTTIRTLANSTYSQSGFKKVQIPIPQGAKDASTRFRWKQNNYDNCDSDPFNVVTWCFDNWAMDDVKINNQVDYQFSWLPNKGLNDASVLSPKAKTDQIRTYKIKADDTAFDCTVKDSVKLTPQTVTADFSSSAPVCEYSDATYTDQSSIQNGSLDKSLWDFDDGNTSNAKNPNHQFPDGGAYSVKLVRTSVIGCQDSINQKDSINYQPRAKFTYDTACLGETTNFRDSSTIPFDTVSQYEWDFDGNGTSPKANPGFTFSSPDTFEVTMVAGSSQGCKDTTTREVDIKALPDPDFTFSSTCEKAATSFNDKSKSRQGSIIRRKWEFGDGTSSSKVSPSHTYDTNGQYPVKLTIESAFQCVDSIQKQQPVQPRPEVDFRIPDSAQCLGSNLFNLRNQTTIDSGTLTYEWDLGDGSTSVEGQPTHTYEDTGQYQISLVTTSDSGCVDSTSRQVTLHPMPEPAISVADSAQCLDPNFYQLNNNSQISKGSLSYKWDFDNGEEKNNQSPTISYDTATQFNVMLEAVSDKGCKDTAYQLLTVHPEPEAAFTINDGSQCFANNKFQFTDQTSLREGSLQYDWSFGDGDQASTTNPVHRYSKIDSFQVQQAVTTNKGCQDTTLAKVYTNPNPTASIQVNDDKQCLEPHLFKFENNSSVSSNEKLEYRWDFGDGDTSNQPDPSHRYPTSDTFQPRMIATSDSGCQDTTALKLIVAPQTNVAFRVNDTLQCLRNNEFRFENESAKPTDELDYFWFFGDGNTGRSETARHTYDTTGTYEASLATRTADGCRDTLKRLMYVKPNPRADFTADRGCAGQDLTFKDRSKVNEGTVNQWQYQFGDGDTANIPNPSHNYSQGGWYRVSLVSTSNYGCSDTVTDSVKIYRIPGETKIIRATTTPDGRNKLSWKKARSDIPRLYQIERAKGEGDFKTLRVVNADVRQYEDRSVNVDSFKYRYRVQLIDSCGNQGPFSEPPHQPIQLDANEGKGEPLLNWSGYQGWPVSAYQVQVAKVSGNGFETIGPYRRLAPTRRELVDSLSNLEPGQFCYRIVGFNAGGDTSIRTTSNVSCIDPTIRLFVPDAFSPNGDGINDVFEVKGTYISDITIKIYNRWGEQVFEGESMESSWDGTYNGELAPLGTYTYIISAQGLNGLPLQRDGHFQLIR